MKKTEKNNKVRTHKILNHPILGLVLMVLMCYAIEIIMSQIVTMIGDEKFGSFGGFAAAFPTSIICLLIYRGWFKGEFDGNLKSYNIGKGLLLVLPAASMMLLNLVTTDYSSVTVSSVLIAMVGAIAPGFFEEVPFRGLGASNFMRVWRDEKRIPLSATLAAALFGLMHLLNLTSGAELSDTLVQVVFAFGSGVLFAAVYYRTGNLIPCIIGHYAVDFTAWIGESESTGNSTVELIAATAAGIIMAVFGYYYLRKAKRAEILDIWNSKWKTLEAPAEEAVSEDALEEV